MEGYIVITDKLALHEGGGSGGGRSDNSSQNKIGTLQAHCFQSGVLSLFMWVCTHSKSDWLSKIIETGVLKFSFMDQTTDV